MRINFASALLALTFFCLAAGASAQTQGSKAGPDPREDLAAQKRTVADLRNVGTAMFSWVDGFFVQWPGKAED